MSPLAVGLVLAGSLAHAGWNVLVKRAPGGGGPVFVWAYSLLSVVLLVPVVLAVLLGGGLGTGSAGGGAGSGFGAGVLGASAVSAVLHLAYALVLQRAYARADMSVAYPVARGVGPLLVVLVAVVALGERVGGLALAGVGGVLAGVVLVSSGGAAPVRAAQMRAAQVGASRAGTPAQVRATQAAPQASSAWSGAAHGVLVGCTIAAYTLWDDHAVNDLGAGPVPYYVGTGVLQCALLTAVLWRRRREAVDVLRSTWRPALAIALLVPTSYVLVLVAMQHAPVSLVATLRCTSIVFGSLAGWLLLGERSGGRRLAGALVMLAGVAALVAPSAT